MISGVFTTLAFIGFLGIAAWAYARRNRARFDEAAQLPLTEDAAHGPAASATGCARVKVQKSNELPYEWPPSTPACCHKEAGS
jgi:cytochrome c oxidase cbb3-type subunit 4